MHPNFCQFKTAYIVDPDDSELDPLSDRICDDTLSYIIKDDELPDGWTFRGTDISGAAGFVLTFDIEDIMPTVYQLDQVDNYIRRLCHEMYDHVRNLPYHVLAKLSIDTLEEFNIELN